MTRLHPVDARTLWAAPTARSDQFLLFAFDDTPASADAAAGEVLAAALMIERLNLVVREVPAHLDYPRWVSSAATAGQVRGHRLVDTSWPAMLTALVALMSDQVDPGVHPWRVHLFGPVDDPSGGGARLRVAVLQISHALADGRGASETARALFGGQRAGPPSAGFAEPSIPPMAQAAGGVLRLPGQVCGLIGGGLNSYRLSRAPRAVGPPPVAAAKINRRPGPRRALRTLTVAKDDIAGRITPAVIAAIGDTMAAAAWVDGDPVVELTLARAPRPGRANNFQMAGIASRTDLVGVRRTTAITAAIDAARARDRERARVVARAAEAATPAALMHWATTAFEPGEPDSDPPGAVTGHTVVSSVNRGGDDLFLAGGRVRFTAGFPALSAVHCLTHGIHGIGRSVTISVVADPDVIDIDNYAAGLRERL